MIADGIANRIANLIGKRIDLGLYVGSLFSILPFLILAFYIHPHYDDYDFHSKAVEQGLGSVAQHWWNTWSGRYASIWLTSVFALPMNPENLLMYRLSSMFFILCHVVTAWYVIRAIFKSSTGKTLLWTLVASSVLIAGMPQVTSQFYYAYVGINTGSASLVLVVLILMTVKMLGAAKVNWLQRILTLVLAFYIGGSYEQIFVTTILILGGLWLFTRNSNGKREHWLLVIASVVILAGVLNVIAPGNTVRGGENLMARGASHFVWAISISLYHGGRFLLEALQSPTMILLSLISIPVFIRFWKNNGELYSRVKVHPILAFVLLFLILAASFFPSLWATGEVPKPRGLNQTWIFLFFGWFSVLGLACQTFAKQLSFTKNSYWKPLIGVFLFISLVPSLTNKHAGRAWSDILTKAAAYDEEMDKRYQFIKSAQSAGQNKVEIEPLFKDPKDFPLSIYYNYQELSIRPKAFDIQNRIYAHYWQVDSIWMATDSQYIFLNNSRQE